MSMVRPKQRPIRLKKDQKRELRTQFGALCYRVRKGKLQFLLVTSRRTKRWIVPKGWPMGGQTATEAAATEAFEEAGVEGKISPVCLGLYHYTKGREGDDLLPCIVAVFPLKVTREHDDYREKNQRARKWFSRKKAAAAISDPEMRHIINSFDPRTL